MRRKSFTMVEILIVAAIISLLAGMGLAAMVDAKSYGRFGRWLGYKSNLKADPSLLIYYDFQDDSGSVLKNRAFGISIDSYTPGNADAEIDDASWASGRWRAKGALAMNGVDSLALIGDKNAFKNIPQEFSFEFWIYPFSLDRSVIWQTKTSLILGSNIHEIKDDKNNNKHVKEPSSVESLSIEMQNDEINFNYIADITYRKNPNNRQGDGNGYAWGTKVTKTSIENQTFSFQHDFKPERWYHIILTYSFDDSSVKFYLDGELKQQFEEDRPVLYLFGASSLGGSQQPGISFNGLIDEFALYNRALTPADVKAHYEMGRPR